MNCRTGVALIGLSLSLLGCASLTKPRYVTGQALSNTGLRASQLHNFTEEEQTAITDQARKEGVSKAEVETRILIHRRAFNKAMDLLNASAKDINAIAQALGLGQQPAGGAQ